MKIFELESLLGDLYFISLNTRLREFGIRKTVEVESKVCCLKNWNDFLAVWPSRVTKQWIRAGTIDMEYSIDKDMHYKKAVYYDSDFRILYLVDSILIKKLVIPPL